MGEKMGFPRLFPRLEIRGFSCSLAELFLAPHTHLLWEWNLGQYIYITMICITLISIHLQLGLLYKCSKCSIKNWRGGGGGGGGGSATFKLPTDLLQYPVFVGQVVGSMWQEKVSLSEGAGCWASATSDVSHEEKPVDEKPQAAVTDGRDKSTLLAVTAVHSGQGGGKWTAPRRRQFHVAPAMPTL